MTITERVVDNAQGDTRSDVGERIAALEAKVDHLSDLLTVIVEDVEIRARQRTMVTELTEDLNGISTEAMAKVVDLLAVAEAKGYFDFARAGVSVADRVVANFEADDLDALGDNVVTILSTVREITQPELLTLLGRMVDAVRAEQAAVDVEPAEPPSLLALLGQLRDPDVRRGMGRALHTLRTVSVSTGPQPSTA